MNLRAALLPSFLAAISLALGTSCRLAGACASLVLYSTLLCRDCFCQPFWPFISIIVSLVIFFSLFIRMGVFNLSVSLRICAHLLFGIYIYRKRMRTNHCTAKQPVCPMRLCTRKKHTHTHTPSNAHSAQPYAHTAHAERRTPFLSRQVGTHSPVCVCVCAP